VTLNATLIRATPNWASKGGLAARSWYRHFNVDLFINSSSQYAAIRTAVGAVTRTRPWSLLCLVPVC
jgi:hypothetical protein